MLDLESERKREISGLEERITHLEREVKIKDRIIEKLRGRHQSTFVTLDTIKDPLIMVDENNEIELVNKSALELLGYSRKETAGMNVSEFLRKDKKLIEILENVGRFKFPRLIQKDFTVLDKRGKEIKIDLTVTVRTDEEGRYIGALLILDQISALKSGLYKLADFFGGEVYVAGGLRLREINAKIADRYRLEAVQATIHPDSKYKKIVVDLSHVKKFDEEGVRILFDIARIPGVGAIYCGVEKENPLYEALIKSGILEENIFKKSYSRLRKIWKEEKKKK